MGGRLSLRWWPWSVRWAWPVPAVVYALFNDLLNKNIRRLLCRAGGNGTGGGIGGEGDRLGGKTDDPRRVPFLVPYFCEPLDADERSRLKKWP